MRAIRDSFYQYILCVGVFSGLVSCTYTVGPGTRSIPGGYSKVAIPVFKNLSQEVGTEVYFTNSLLREFHNSKVAEVVPQNRAEVVIEGEISSLNYHAQGLKKAGPEANLPLDTVLATNYYFTLICHIRIKRASDGVVVWEKKFSGQRSYNAPQIATPGLNSANSLYNLSSRRQSVEVLAQDLMAEAYSRMTESF